MKVRLLGPVQAEALHAELADAEAAIDSGRALTLDQALELARGACVATPG